MAMQQLAISNDWLPIDRWIAEALDQSIPASQIESDLVDCLLFWSAKFSKKGASSRDSLAKSLEAVRILVSLGLAYPADLRSLGGAPPRLRELFKIPFARLKSLASGSRIESILGMESSSKALSAYWNSESKERIDNRLYAMVRGNFETAAALATLEKELLSILRRLIRITGIPCPLDETRAVDTVEIQSLIRTLLALHLNRIKRPTPRRQVTESIADSHFIGFEPLTQAELKTIQGNGSLTGKRKTEIDREFAGLIEQLAVSDEAMAEICGRHPVSWSAYVARLRDIEHHFACEEAPRVDQSEEDEETRRTLESVFSEPLTEYSRKELEMRRNAMPKDELERLLITGTKMGFISVRKEGSRKLYRLEPTESDAW